MLGLPLGFGIEGFLGAALGLLIDRMKGMCERITHLGRDPHTELTFARGKHSAALHGFSLYAGPRIDPCSTHRIEKLARSIVRPPIATPRLSLTSSGKVLYKLERPFKDGPAALPAWAMIASLCRGGLGTAFLSYRFRI